MNRREKAGGFFVDRKVRAGTSAAIATGRRTP